MRLSRPKPTRDTDPAINPATIEINPSRLLYATVKYSRTRPRCTSWLRSAVARFTIRSVCDRNNCNGVGEFCSTNPSSKLQLPAVCSAYRRNPEVTFATLARGVARQRFAPRPQADADLALTLRSAGS